MNDLPIFEGMEELATGLGVYCSLAMASAILQIVFGGWKGLRHALSVVLSALVFCIIAGWCCQYYQLPWVATAAITCGAGLLSNAVMSIIFHPAIREAIVSRMAEEIRTRGKKEGAKQGLQNPEDSNQPGI